ncbi:transient receptor potential ion channel [Colletotrichum karsti]|uniref:Transient receptor potential ion channel n=1 Tax=Colletotrichum karsti TaxID=1095194 RepID=A0A9P6HXP3_9PEZI|nr:transient receptor potential ion channel [Colletotrichum karsti]KAF9873413.1 transient receptor potential ion channel [Colletotrichum karsti]
MRFSRLTTLLTFISFAALLPSVFAERILQSSSLNSCQKQSDFSASLFTIVVSADNGTVTCNVAAVVSVEGKAIFDVALRIYGYEYMRQTINPCEMDLQGLCPMKPGKINMEFSFPIGDKLDQVPGIAFTIPDLDATVHALINLTDSDTTVACIEADFSNGKTVNLNGVKWATAVIAGIGLLSAGFISAKGHTDNAAHLAANALSLFGYFQAQAFVGLTGVDMPPIVQAWTQNFQWSMGIVRIGFIQDLATWYQRATGGEAADLLTSMKNYSVQVSKRSLDVMENYGGPVKRAVSAIAKRSNIKLDNGSYIVYGIQRVAFKARIETTNLFLTGLIIYMIFVGFTIACVAAFKGLVEIAAKKGMVKGDRFVEFRRDWKITLKGVLFRLNLIGFPQIAVLCLWEFVQHDSPAIVVLAVFFFFGTLFTLIWASWKVIRIARQSILTHQNPAHVLFSNPAIINKWGFLYVQYRASAYYFVIPFIAYIFIKSAVIAFGQGTGAGQAIALIIIEAAALIAVSALKPFMDKSTNSFNISIAAINFINSIFLLIFTNVFGTPGIVIGVVGVILFVVNVIFALVLLLMVLISSILVFWRVKGQPIEPSQLHDPSVMAKRDGTENKSLLDLDEDDKPMYRRESVRSVRSMYGGEKAMEDGRSQPRGAADSHEMSYLPSPTTRPAVSPAMPLFPADPSLRPLTPTTPRSPAGNDPPQSPFATMDEFRSKHNNR